MKKKLYSMPQTGVNVLTADVRLMQSQTTSIVLPPDMAPARRSGHGPGEAPVF